MAEAIIGVPDFGSRVTEKTRNEHRIFFSSGGQGVGLSVFKHLHIYHVYWCVGIWKQRREKVYFGGLFGRGEVPLRTDRNFF